MPNNKLLTLLGFASKARKLSFGMDGSLYSVKRGDSFLALTASDISDKSKKEVRFFSYKNNIPFIVIDLTIEELSHAVGKKTGIISVNDKGFASSILRILEGGNANDKV